MEWYEKLEKIRDYISDESIIEAMGNYFDSYQIEDFCNELIIDNDLDLEFSED